MSGLFNTLDSSNMFVHLQKKWESFYHHPSEERLIDTLLPLYHLREWICPGSSASYKNKDELTAEEKLHSFLYTYPPYEVVRELCNRTKHFKKQNGDINLNVIKGARTGLMRVGDALGSTYFTVDGVDIRDIFMAVYRVYYQYFESVKQGKHPSFTPSDSEGC
ncbi:hypothetical protein HLB26_21305 [Dickeya dadantii]|uniref:hypothetical protein n=1 Tax=Dickeya dadantii TaxID=204038 RepID=UPI0014959A7B|nr:hypothetical protein [Dickeya dadantii]NPE61370.1 hypothetical protein [Dickeya dadantii]